MAYPENLKYSKDHEWVSAAQGDVVTVGITEFAAEQLGDVVEVTLPDVGSSFDQGDVFGTIDSVKAASDLFAPISGEVVEINEELADSPELVNEAPHDKGWMIKLKIKGDDGELLSAADYQRFLDDQ